MNKKAQENTVKNFSDIADQIVTRPFATAVPQEAGWTLLQVRDKREKTLLDEFPVPANPETVEEFKRVITQAYGSPVQFEAKIPSHSELIKQADEMVEAKRVFLGVKRCQGRADVPITKMIPCFTIDETQGWKVRTPDGREPGFAQVKGLRFLTEADLKKLLGVDEVITRAEKKKAPAKEASGITC